MVLFRRSFFYIYPIGLLGCFLAGFVNGSGIDTLLCGVKPLGCEHWAIAIFLLPFVRSILAFDRSPADWKTHPPQIDRFSSRRLPVAQYERSFDRFDWRWHDVGSSSALRAPSDHQPTCVVRSALAYCNFLHTVVNECDRVHCLPDIRSHLADKLEHHGGLCLRWRLLPLFRG